MGSSALHQRRLRIEHVHGSVKRCRIVKDRIRLWKQGIRDLVMELCCALHNFRVRLTPHIPHPSDGDSRIFPGVCFARTANLNRGMLSSHERRYAKHLCLRSVVWGSFYRPSKRTKSNICPL
jgi:hypothetical protein